MRPIRVPRLSTLRFSAGSLGYVGGTLVAAFVSPAAALGIYGLIGVYYLFEHLPDSSGSADGAGGPDGCGPAGADGTGGQFAAGQPG